MTSSIRAADLEGNIYGRTIYPTSLTVTVFISLVVYHLIGTDPFGRKSWLMVRTKPLPVCSIYTGWALFKMADEMAAVVLLTELLDEAVDDELTLGCEDDGEILLIGAVIPFMRRVLNRNEGFYEVFLVVVPGYCVDEIRSHPGPRGAVRERDVCDLQPEIPYWWRASVPNLVRSADWLAPRFAWLRVSRYAKCWNYKRTKYPVWWPVAVVCLVLREKFFASLYNPFARHLTFQRCRNSLFSMKWAVSPVKFSFLAWISFLLNAIYDFGGFPWLSLVLYFD